MLVFLADQTSPQTTTWTVTSEQVAAAAAVVASVVAVVAAVITYRSARKSAAIEQVRSSAQVKIWFAWQPEHTFPEDWTTDWTPEMRAAWRRADLMTLRNDGPARATAIKVALVGPKGSWSRIIPKLDPGEIDEYRSDMGESAHNEEVVVYLEWFDALATRYSEEWSFRRRSPHARQGNIATGPAGVTAWLEAEVSSPAHRDVFTAEQLTRPAHFWRKGLKPTVNYPAPSAPEGWQAPDDWANFSH